LWGAFIISLALCDRSCGYPLFTVHLLQFPIVQASLESEREKASEWEKKYTEAQESSEEKHKKLEETERRVHQLQDSLNR